MKTNKIIIVGGGSAGWMTAATLISQFPDKDISLIESPNIATVGVGESTIGQINDWMSLLGIKDEDFMKHTDASYKLSIRFENFYKKGDGGFHYPFGTMYENDYDRKTWWYKKMISDDLPYTDFANSMYDQMSLVNNNTIFKNEKSELPSFNFKADTAYHFDATKFGLWLKEHYCLPRGVKHYIGNVKPIGDENGIKELKVDDISFEADLFIDCTGFASILLSKTLKEPFESYSDILPNNKAWATRVPYSNKEEQLEPFTNCTALENGWVWNIPSWERIGTGYVYSDKFVSDEEALEQLKNHLSEKGLDYSNSQFKNIKMRVGIHKRLFVKNVVAIGLSSGFIEPLESNGLYTTHEFLLKLVRTLGRGNSDSVNQYDKDVFNTVCKAQFRGFAEFVALHYALSHRDDTEYWKDISEKVFDNKMIEQKLAFQPGLLTNAFDKFERRGFPEFGGINCIATGMRYLPIDKYLGRYYKHIDSMNELVQVVFDSHRKEFEKMKKNKEDWNEIAKKQLSLKQYLEKYIHN